MAKRKAGKAEAKRGAPSSQERLEDLAELAGKLNLPDDALDGDLRDAVNEEANLIYKGVKDSVLLDKLEFLHRRGYQIGRLKTIIEELSRTKERETD
jgi:hypothetical protein